MAIPRLITTAEIHADMKKFGAMGCKVSYDEEAGNVTIWDGDEIVIRAIQKGFNGPWITRFFNTTNFKWTE